MQRVSSSSSGFFSSCPICNDGGTQDICGGGGEFSCRGKHSYLVYSSKGEADEQREAFERQPDYKDATVFAVQNERNEVKWIVVYKKKQDGNR